MCETLIGEMENAWDGLGGVLCLHFDIDVLLFEWSFE